MNYLIRRFVTLSLLAALPGACVEKEGDTTTGSATETSGDSTGASASDSTGATGDSTGPTGDDSGATGDDSGTDGDTTSEPTTGEPTTGEPSAVCVAYTEWVYGCGLGAPQGEQETTDECERQRQETTAVYGPECMAKSDAYVECLVESACDDFEACEPQAEAADECLPEAGATCTKFAANVSVCEPGESEAELAGSCQFEINVGGLGDPECGAAMEALYSCYSGLTCVEIEAEDNTCAQQEAMTDVLCAGQSGGPVHQQGVELGTHRR